MPSGIIDLPKVIAQIGNTDLGSTLLKVLSVVGMPTIDTDAQLGRGVLGSYTPASDEMKLSWKLAFPKQTESVKNIDTQNTELVTTAGHELTHAAVNKMSSMIYDKASGFPAALRKEIEKFSNSSSEVPVSKLISKSGEDEYRSSWSERLGFGVGNTIGIQSGGTAVRPVPHADATSATEFAIQADLFQRGIKQMMSGKK